MSIDVQALKAKADIVSVVGSYGIALKKRGAEYVGLCVAHDDKNPSMWVSPTKGLVHCFACEFNADAIDFVMHMDGIDFKAACEKLGATDTWTPKAPIKQEAKPRPERHTMPPPADAPPPNMEVRSLGKPSHTWCYRAADGSPLMYVARYDTPQGKEIRCFSWASRPGEAAAWHCCHYNRGERPLYQLDRIANATQVLVVEGEKAADAAQQHLKGIAVTTWPGGAQAWKHAHLEPLRGRNVVLWPDADEAGRDAMAKLAPILADPKGLACKVKVIDTAGLPESFDAADWQGEDLVAWLKPRAREYTPPAPPPERRKPTLAVVDGNTAKAAEPVTEPLPAAMSEDALAEHFAETYGENWRHVKEWGQWFEWDGDRWAEDTTSKAERLAIQVTRESLYWAEAAQLTPKERRQISKKSTAWAIRDMAATDRRIAASVDQWDQDPLLLGVPGGVIDLRTGQTLDAAREQYISKRTAIAPQSGTPHKWLEYMNRVHEDNPNIIGYLQRYAGYCCTGETKEHALAFLYGTGRNGKGVFLETISRILGDYARTASMDTFMEQRHAAHSTELARLHGARLVITEEAASGGRWNEARIKHITGGGKITAHYMRQDDFEFAPAFKLLIAANHKPMLRAVDEAIKARIHLVPFRVTIPAEERDQNLLQKLEAEWPQILAWILDGCTEWQRNGLQVPPDILDATNQYVEAEDVLGAWLEDCCERDGYADGKQLFDNYRKWCEAQGEHAWSRRAWSNAMLERGFDNKRTKTSRGFQGVSLKPAAMYGV